MSARRPFERGWRYAGIRIYPLFLYGYVDMVCGACPVSRGKRRTMSKAWVPCCLLDIQETHMRGLMRMARRFLAAGFLLALVMVNSALDANAFAHDNTEFAGLPLPAGEVLLVIDGAIRHVNLDSQAHFDMEMIEALPAHRLHTSTAVTDGVRQFDGFLMRDVLERVGVQGTLVEAKALNHYSVDIPIADFHDYEVLLATHMDGERLQPSGKGPFWIVYPRDDWRQLQDIRYDYRWVWQLNRLTVK